MRHPLFSRWPSFRVVNITTSQHGVDRAITLVPSDASVWSVIYDHVSNVRVSIGQTVSAGAQLGTVGVLNNGRGRTELQVNRFDPAPTLSYCPQTCGTGTVCTTSTIRP